LASPTDKEIDMSNWKWFGHAGHFICADKCRFHLTTKVGKYLVSTVGEYWPERVVREIHAEVHDKKWFAENRNLKGDYFDHAYMKKFGFEEIGCDRKYETMVFKAGKPCSSKFGIRPSPLASGPVRLIRGYEALRFRHYKPCRWFKSGFLRLSYETDRT
jgi:hypothetical protein